jgi:serine/threonine protein kinase
MNEQELVGVTLGSSTIERVIGQGGMAMVYLAQQARPTRAVAVKVLLPAATGSDPEQQRVFLERFRREADTAAKLEHKNILPVYEYAEATVKGQRLAYLVMPYIRGGTLRQRIDEFAHTGQRFDLPTISSYISQIADALNYAHSLGVIHRDIKPGNLLFHVDGRLLLTDFGIARLSALPSLTMAGSFIGTAEYASPEQVSAGELDARSDIYSLGIILYELLTGAVPFAGSTPFAIMARQLHDAVPSVRSQRPDLSPAVEFVVKKALAKDPQGRYQQASELAADLQAAVQPAIAQQAGLRLGGDASHSDQTVADRAWQPPTPRAIGPTSPLPGTVNAPAPVARTQPASRPPLPPTQSPGAVWQQPAQVQAMQAAPDLDESVQVKLYRPGRRLYFYIIGLATLILQFITLGLTLHQNLQNGDTSAIVLGVLLGNALNLLCLAAIAFTGITRQRDIRAIFQRTLWVIIASLVLSGFFISYGDFTSRTLQLPLISYLILLASNMFVIRQLSQTDAAHEQIEVAPVFWRSAIVGALTGLIPLLIILVFALVVPLPWISGGSLFLRLLGALLVGFIGAPTPGAMMAVSLSEKISFPTLVRTSAVAGLFMFLASYVLVVLTGLLVSGHILFAGSFSQEILVPAVLIMGLLLGLIGLLRGMLDAWVYYRVMMRRA